MNTTHTPTPQALSLPPRDELARRDVDAAKALFATLQKVAADELDDWDSFTPEYQAEWVALARESRLAMNEALAGAVPTEGLPALPAPHFENHDNGDTFGHEKTYMYAAAEMLAYGRAVLDLARSAEHGNQARRDAHTIADKKGTFAEKHAGPRTNQAAHAAKKPSSKFAAPVRRERSHWTGCCTREPGRQCEAPNLCWPQNACARDVTDAPLTMLSKPAKKPLTGPQMLMMENARIAARAGKKNGDGAGGKTNPNRVKRPKSAGAPRPNATPGKRSQ